MVATRIHHREPLEVEASYYGLHPDRTASQQATALLEAQAALPVGRGGKILIDASPEDYWPESLPTLNSGETIEGRGPRNSRLRVTSLTEHGIKILGASAGSTTGQTGLRDLALIGPGKASGGSGHGIHIKWGSFGLLFENVWVYGWGSHGVYCEDTYTTAWRDCRFQDNGGDGWHGLTNINQTVWDACNFLSNGGAGLQVVGGAGIKADTCNAESNGTYGIDWRYVHGGIVDGGDYERNALAHIYLHWRSGMGEPCNGILIEGANFTGAGITPSGILVDGANMAVIGEANVFQGHTSEDVKCTANATRTILGSGLNGGANPSVTDLSNSLVKDYYDVATLMKTVSPGLRFEPRSASPATLAEGMVWYRGDLDQLRLHDGARTRTLFSGVDAAVEADPPNVAANGTGVFTVTVTGAAITDRVHVQAPPDLSPALSIANAWVSAADTVTIRLRNHSGLDVNQGTGPWRVTVIKS